MIGQIIQAIGGRDNITHCGHCMTRLRLSLADSLHADRDTIKRIAGVMGVIESDNQFQIVLGPGKAQTACELMNGMLSAGLGALEAPAAAPTELGDIASANKQALKQKQSSAAHRFLAKFATIFTPLIPGFIAAGLLLGFATLIEQTLLQDGAATGGMLVELVGYMKLFSKGLFSFLSILIGYNAQKAFGGSGVNGAILASLFVMGYDPQATSGIYSGITDFFGHHIDPRGNIIGVLIACIIGASVERQVRRFMPDSLDMILTSCITLLIMGAVTFVLIMPLGVQLYNGMSWRFTVAQPRTPCCAPRSRAPSSPACSGSVSRSSTASPCRGSNPSSPPAAADRWGGSWSVSSPGWACRSVSTPCSAPPASSRCR